MDNLYNSVTFARAAYDMGVPQKDGPPRKKRVKTQGVIRASRGVPACVKQTLPKGKAAMEEVRGSTKVAVLRGDTKSKDLIVGSCIDQKEFFYFVHDGGVYRLGC